MKITSIAVRYPTLTAVATLIVLVWGLSYFMTMSRREDPELTFRGARIITYFPGALPEDIEQYVTKPLEDAAAEIGEVSEINSTSRYSVSVIFVSLEDTVPASEVDQYWDQLRAKIASIRDTLPDGASDPVVDDDIFDTSSHILCISGDDYSPRELAAFAERIKNRLSLLPAAGKVEVWADQPERIYLEYSLTQMTRYGLTLDHLLETLRGTNLMFPGGEIEVEGTRYLLDATGGFKSLADIENLPIYGTPGAQQVRLGDLGKINYSYEDPPGYLARVNGRPCVIVAVVMKSGMNVMALGQQVEDELERIRTSLPADLELTLLQDQPYEVSLRIDNFLGNLYLGIGLVILVVFLFMGIRSSLPVGMAIPLVLVASFAVLSFLGTSLQQMSIAGLIIALGMLVDNAIVVTDNISRYVDRGVERKEAAIKATSELALPMLTSSLTTVCAFIPLLMLRGTASDFIRDIPVTVSIAIALSFVIALTVTPVVCSLVITRSAGRRMYKPLDPLMRILERCYPPLLRWTQRNRIHTGLFVAGAFAGSLMLFPTLGIQFFPGADRDQFVIDMYLPEGSSTHGTSELARYVEEILAEHEAIRSFMVNIGQSGPKFYYNRFSIPSASNYAEFLVNTDSPQATARFVPLLRTEVMRRVPGARLEVKFLGQGPPVGAPIQIKVRGELLAELKRIGSEVKEILTSVDGVIDIHDSFGEDSRQLVLNVDQTKLRAIGLTKGQVNQRTAWYFSGLPVTEYRAPSRTIPVILRVYPEMRDQATDLDGIYLPNQFTGDSVPLASLAHFETVQVTSKITRLDRVREMTVSAYLEDGVLASAALAEAWPRIAALELPPGYNLVQSGEAEERGEAFAGLAAGLLVAMLLIVLILVAQFKSVRIAAVVFLAIPLGLIGAILGLYVTGWPFGFTAGLGVIALTGIVINNSIMLMDFIMVELRAGHPLDEAIARAGQARLRPIILTTVTTICGLLPLGLFGGSMWAPMCFAIIGGLIVSTFLTLIVVPLLFRAVAGRRAMEIVAMERRQAAPGSGA